ncbi:unnamed protein product [Acanthoscelides obtectus]|nr:unnamed protein product [Acanthoscelides obtectus]CAK1649490.1 Probable multidrug resistance-associated protein lethal(2)03659 [Acanthoscelides obtectus]
MYLTSAALVLLALANNTLHHHCICGMLRTGIKIRASISTLVYRKIIRLNQNVLGRSTSSGQIINLLSNDLCRIDTMLLHMHTFWILPIQVVIICYLIWRQVGISTLAGVLSMTIFSVPVQGYLSKLTGRLRLKIAEKTDKRVKMMTEIVSGIQVIKMYTWEKPFENLIHFIRKSEVNELTKSSYLNGFYNSCMVFLDRLSLFTTIVCYVLLGNSLTPDKVFSMGQLFNFLQLQAAVHYPMAVTSTSQCWVSLKRLEQFLALEEKEESRIQKCNKGELSLSSVSASWTKVVPTLKHITLHLKPGSLCAIVGPVGAGKSSIIQVLLGELPFSSGTTKVGGDISYASQQPWLFSATARQNIIFGLPYDRKRYNKVVKVCALKKDFMQFPYGDHTVVGDRGASLSGGQRARINLARAVYRQASIYLLDDPLSAVDAHVGKHLFSECIYKYLRGKLRILVTHQLQFLMKADVVIVVNRGEIEAVGTYNELSSQNLDFSKLLKLQEEDNENVDDDDDIGIRRNSVRSSTRSTSSIDSTSDICDVKQFDDNETDTVKHQVKSPLKEYIMASSDNFLIFSLFVVLILSQGMCSGNDYWVAYWTTQEEIRHSGASNPLHLQTSNNETIHIPNIYPNKLPNYSYNLSTDISNMSQKPNSSNFYDDFIYRSKIYHIFKTDIAISIYGILMAIVIVFMVARSIMFFRMCMLSSINLHRTMFTSLLAAPMRFFNTNPSGRILNRFSKDVGAVDELLPMNLIQTIQIGMVVVGILVNVCVANNYAAVAVIILGFVFFKIYEAFKATTKGLKHLEGVTKSPVFTYINSTVTGLASIRSCKIENILVRQFDSHQDVNTSSWWLLAAVQCGLGIWIDALCAVFIACIAFSFIVVQSVLGNTDGSMVGLALQQAFILTGMLQHGLRQACDVISHLTSVERVLQYTAVEPEEHLDEPKDVPSDSWPSKGTIQFQQLYLRYDVTEPFVLKGISFTICDGEKIGVVGRTGAGKSSLIAALFRLAPLEGAIYIDEVDTQKVSLPYLRKHISIIPQEPVLFSASVRYNLDPFEEFGDAEIWRALEEVELKLAVPSLDFLVSEGGGNFSAGERQLLCLARAILRNNRILIMDEATANVDQRTDAFIQETIRRRFKDRTVITIAHRLNTIMDSDRVMVMSSGSVLEFDHPHKLLQIPEGHFHKMVLETGRQMANELEDIALEAYHKKYQ